MALPISTLKKDYLNSERGCYRCHRKPEVTIRDLHQVGYKDYYDDNNPDIVIQTKKVWAPCSEWFYCCPLHVRSANYWEIGEQCPHGITGEQRGIPVPNMPLIGEKAIVLETDL